MKKTNLTFISCLSLLLALLLLATACGGSGAPKETDAPTDSEALTEAVTGGETLPETEDATEKETTPETEIGNGEETTVETPPETEAGTDAPEDPKEPEGIAIAGPEIIDFDTRITITQEGNKASVQANDGLAYTATGHKSISGQTFVINKGFTVSFTASAAAKADFNRFSIGYVSDQPLKGTVT